MFNPQNDEIIDVVDFHLNCHLRSAMTSGPSSQLTVRVSDSLRDDLDILCDYLGGITRNSLINEFLEAAVHTAIRRVDDNPYVFEQTNNGMTISQAREAARLAREGSTK